MGVLSIPLNLSTSHFSNILCFLGFNYLDLKLLSSFEANLSNSKPLKKFVFLFIWIVFINKLYAQQKFTISGKVTDAKNGEELIGVSISAPSLKSGTATNSYGFYSLTLPAGNYELEYSYIGFELQKKSINLNKNIDLNIELNESKKQLNEVLIKSDRLNNDNVTQNKMSVVKIDVKRRW